MQEKVIIDIIHNRIYEMMHLGYDTFTQTKAWGYQPVVTPRYISGTKK
jgi:hypothetical protein